jgi:hypothetical protein
MKKAFWGPVIGGSAAGLFALGWFCNEYEKAQSVKSMRSTAAMESLTHSQPKPIFPPGSLITAGDSQHLFEVRQAALHDNPDLVAEYDQILKDLQAEEVKVDAEMVKVDPKVAPILAKLKILRQHSRVPSALSGNSK